MLLACRHEGGATDPTPTMTDFEPSSPPLPLDQADGLRRLFGGRRRVVLPLVADPHVGFGGVVLDRLAQALSAQGRHVLVVDAATGSPPPAELAAVDLALCIETLAPRVDYLAAGGLATAYVDTRGCAEGLIAAVQHAHPAADVVLLHADASDLARILKRRAARPMLLGADHPDSIKHAYAGAKLLATRCGLLTFDLLLAMPARSPRAAAIVQSLAGCAETFLGALLVHHARIDPTDSASADAADRSDELARLLAAQLALDDAGIVPLAPHTAFPSADGPRQAVGQR
jgi:flagellar biosynthesis protein FlhG